MNLRANQPNTVRVRRARNPVCVLLMRFAVIAGSTVAISSKATLPTSDLPNFDGLPNFAQLGNSIDVHNATVNGNEGVSSGGLLDLDQPGIINGNVSVANGATFNHVGTVTGSVFTGQDLSSEQSSVFSDSSDLALLPAVQTVATDETSPLSYDVPAGQLEVVDLNGGLDLKHTDDITLTGGGDLLLNISGSFTLQDAASILGDASNIFINYTGTNSVTTKENDVVDGQIFLPNAGATLKSKFFGGIYSGDQNVELLANAVLNGVAPVPEPTTDALVLMSAGFVPFLLLARRRRCNAEKSNLRKKAKNDTSTNQPINQITT